MTAHSPRRLVLALSFGAALATSQVIAGGWAVITVAHLPDSVIVGEPMTLAYVVRQHGAHLLKGLTGRVTATNAGREVVAAARADKHEPRYTATLTLPNAGEWTITIDSGFAGRGTLTLLPLPAVASTEPVAAMPIAERGRRLFVAKGCATCHGVSGADLPASPMHLLTLVPHKYQAEYLAQVLAAPALIPRSSASAFRMPKLELEKGEIEALVAFINRKPVPTAASNDHRR
jgi:hypothetical protein